LLQVVADKESYCGTRFYSSIDGGIYRSKEEAMENRMWSEQVDALEIGSTAFYVCDKSIVKCKITDYSRASKSRVCYALQLEGGETKSVWHDNLFAVEWQAKFHKFKLDRIIAYYHSREPEQLNNRLITFRVNDPVFDVDLSGTRVGKVHKIIKWPAGDGCAYRCVEDGAGPDEYYYVHSDQLNVFKAYSMFCPVVEELQHFNVDEIVHVITFLGTVCTYRVCEVSYGTSVIPMLWLEKLKDCSRVQIPGSDEYLFKSYKIAVRAQMKNCVEDEDGGGSKLIPLEVLTGAGPFISGEPAAEPAVGPSADKSKPRLRRELKSLEQPPAKRTRSRPDRFQ